MKKQLSSLAGIRLLLAGTLVLLGAAQAAIAQEETTTASRSSVVQPRIGIRYNTEGAGFDPYVNFEGFLPLHQTPGQDLIFIDSRLILATPTSALGGNVNLGYRFLDATKTWIYGAYVAFDYRNTGASTFNQVGLGVEGLSEGLDFRVNGYLPVGNSRNLTASGLSGTNPIFQQNLLLIDRLQSFQVALWSRC